MSASPSSYVAPTAYSPSYCTTTVQAVVAAKEQQLLASIELMKEQLLGQLRAKAASLEGDLSKGIERASFLPPSADNTTAAGAAVVAESSSSSSTAAAAAAAVVPHADMIAWLIPFTDHANKVLAKIANTYMPRELLFDVCNVVAAYCHDYFNNPAISTAKPTTSSAGSSDADGAAAAAGTMTAATRVTKEEMAARYRTAKNKFDLICNYSKRKDEDIPNTGLFYDEDLCVYLMSKTFKKSATDAYECFFAMSSLVEGDGADDKEKTSSSSSLINFLRTTSELRLGSIGGGPSSDMTGMVAYFYDLMASTPSSSASSADFVSPSTSLLSQVKLYCQVFDIMDVNWCTASRIPIAKGYGKYLLQGTAAAATAAATAAKKEAKKKEGGTIAADEECPPPPSAKQQKKAAELAEKKDGMHIWADAENGSALLTTSNASSSSSSLLPPLVVEYKHIDLKEPSTVLPIVADLNQLHFISVCWALNEALFVPSFWELVLANTPKAFIMIVEGKEDKLDMVVAVCGQAEINRAYYYDRFESPRRLIIKPKTV